MIIYNQKTPILMVPTGKIEIINHIHNQLKRIEPQQLYVFFNTPKNEEEKSKQSQIQSILDETKWDCKVTVYFSKEQTDDKVAMLKAVRWFFKQVDEGIILNGMKTPYPAFFAFCSCMLEKYRNDARIGHISTCDFLKNDRKSKTTDSYYFSKLIHTNGMWASWRRVWEDMDSQLKTFPAFKKLNYIDEIPTHKAFHIPWFYLFNYETRWENRYEYMNLINNRLAVVPDVRKISLKEYELQDINHPAIMVNPTIEELRLQELKYKMPAVTRNKPSGLAFLRQKLLSFHAEAKQRMKIPRIIHQIYEDPAGPPEDLLKIAESWKKKMPEWEYRFWTKQMIHDFLKSTCPDFFDIYKAYPFNVQRWDAIRYLILYHIGGLYADMDYECIQPLDVLLSESTCCMGMEPTVNSKFYNKPFIIGNALMASIPKHPYMAAIIEDMKTNFSVTYAINKSFQIIESTGPFMTTRVYDHFNKKKDVTLLSADLVAPLSMIEALILRKNSNQPGIVKKLENAFAIHYFYGTWTDQTVEGKPVEIH